MLYADTPLSLLPGQAVDVSLCSTLNRLLHTQIVNHLQTLAPTGVPCPNVGLLVQRVAQSGVLEPFQQHCSIQEGAQYPWRCFSLKHKDSVFVFVAPSYLSRVKGISQAVMPLLLLHCCKQTVLDPDPAEFDPPGQHPDVYCPLLLCGGPGGEDPSMSHLDHLIVRLKNIYHSSYLHTIHTALRQRQTCASEDFALSMGLCSTATVPVFCTSLVGGLCPHALLWQPGDQGTPTPVAANKLCQLLEGVTEVPQTSKWRVSLQQENPSPGPAHCQDWGPEVEEALGNILCEEGFRVVPLNSGYYWFSGMNSEQEVTYGDDITQLKCYSVFLFPLGS